MKSRVARRLVRLNHAFYEEFAASFAGSRPAVQPGWRRALAGRLGAPPPSPVETPPTGSAPAPGASLLDLGCADGRLLRALVERRLPHALERYCGVELGAAFLARATAGGAARTAPFRVDWVAADLTRPGWSAGVATPAGGFTTATCFATLFHVPGHRRRLRLLREIGGHLAAGGFLVLSIWRFLELPRLRAKVVPWARAGLGPDDVDPGDHLLDWRRDGQGLRYVHHFAPGELERLWRAAGYRLLESFTSDGAPGDLSRYVVLERQAVPPRAPARRAGRELPAGARVG
ncbi:MAG: methyltransferase domain-containing protein [Candidatus Eiseniibacteriota bacterium]|jgi:SAM-dependent methyltransferase